jgi:hypothetical protein
MGAKFCCCLPVRLGVLILSFFQFVFSGAVAGLCWYALMQKSDQFNQKVKIGFIVLGSVQTIAALVAFAGFFGAILKRQRGVRLYSWMLNFQFGIQLVISIIGLVAYFTEPKSEFIKNCVNGSTDQTVIDSCNQTAGISKPVLVVSVVFSLLVHFWFCWIVAAYAQQLRDRQSLHTRAMMLDTSSEFKYEAARSHSHEALRPLTHAEGSYPYADPAHSYGKSTFEA